VQRKRDLSVGLLCHVYICITRMALVRTQTSVMAPRNPQRFAVIIYGFERKILTVAFIPQ